MDQSTLKSFLQTVLALVVLAGMAGAIVLLEAGNQTVLSGKPAVIDGDSLEINGERLRLDGIDAPELGQTCERDGAGWPCGRRSRAALRKLISNGQVSCRTTGIDKYDRWLVDCDVGGILINKAMVEQGWAVAYGDYLAAEESARERGVGIWVGSFERPRQWRDAQHGDLAASPTSVFRIAWIRTKRVFKTLVGL